MNFNEFFVLNSAQLLIEQADLFLEETKWRYIDPLTGKKWRYADRWRQLEAIIKDESQKGTQPRRIWVTFSEVPKLGARQVIRNKEPHGVFAYPATYVVKNKGVPYANSRPYIIVFKVHGNMGETGGKNVDKKWQNQIWPAIKNQFSVTRALDAQKIGPNVTNYVDKLYQVGNVPYRLVKTVRNILSKVAFKIDFSNQDQIKQYDSVKKILDAYEKVAKDELQKILNDEYKEVNPETMTAKLSDEFKSSLESMEGYKKAGFSPEEIDREFNIEELAKVDEMIDYWLDNINNLKEIRENQELISFLEGYVKELKTYLVNREETGGVKDHKIINKLKDLADRYDLDLGEAIRNVASDRIILHGTHFIYLVTKWLAMELANKEGGHFQVRWNQFLRKLGFDHMVDTQNSSTIHAAEPTQGIFMDTSKLEPIDIILNKPRIDPRMRPAYGDTYDSTLAQHARVGAKMLRRGVVDVSDSSQTPGMREYEKTLIALRQRLQMLIKDSFYFDLDEPRVVSRLGMITKILKTINTMATAHANFAQKMASGNLLKMSLQNMLTDFNSLRNQVEEEMKKESPSRIALIVSKQLQELDRLFKTSWVGQLLN